VGLADLIDALKKNIHLKLVKNILKKGFLAVLD
jgi:hypothetical protein